MDLSHLLVGELFRRHLRLDLLGHFDHLNTLLFQALEIAESIRNGAVVSLDVALDIAGDAADAATALDQVVSIHCLSRLLFLRLDGLHPDAFVHRLDKELF